MPDNVLSDLCVLERMRLHMQAKLDVAKYKAILPHPIASANVGELH